MDMQPVLRLDMGNTSGTKDGWIKQDRVYTTPYYGFLKDFYDEWFETGLDYPFKDGICHDTAVEFRMGLAAGGYRLRLYFFDPVKPRGAIRVSLLKTAATAPEGGGEVIQAHEVTPGHREPAALDIEWEHAGGAVGIWLEAAGGTGIIFNALEVYTDAGNPLAPLYPEAPPVELPPADTLPALSGGGAQDYLAELCAWLLAARDADGFMGDFESNKRLWYTASYPIRVLLARYEVSGDKACLDAVTTIVDHFVDEQMPEGGFVQSFLGMRPRDMDEAQREEIRKNNWMNLADIGSMVAALIAACHYVDGERKAGYIAAARKYLDNWASPRIQENGGVKNGWVGTMGEAKNIYSVSTAMTALCMALFYNLTGEDAYIQKANKSIRFLLGNWGADGSPYTWVFDGGYPGGPDHAPAIGFGDTFYTYEGMSALIALTNDEGLRREIYEAYKLALFGARGLIPAMEGRAWWPIQNTWHNSKSAGTLIVLQDFLHWAGAYGEDDCLVQRASRAYQTMCRFLLDKSYARRLGVMLEDPEDIYPFGRHSLQCWTGCAVAATGFAGISTAQMVKYGVVYQKGFE